MTIRQQGGVFGRNPSFNDVDVADLYVSGNIGVRTANAAYPLDVVGSARFSDTVFIGNQRGFRTGTVGSTVYFDLGNIIFRNGNGANNGANLTVYGKGTFTDDIVIGTSGKGIDFSATPGTGTSELFNDYEEGTWTPTFTAAWTTAPTVTSAQYTKFGRQVTVTMLATNGVVTAGGGIGGLPFTSNASQGSGAYGGNSDTTESLQGTVGQSASSITNIPARTLTGNTWQITATYFA